LSLCVFQMSEPSCFFSATMDAPGPPAFTSTRSPRTSGDSLMPQTMFPPPNFWRTLKPQTSLPVAASRHERSPPPPSE
jgi:hypothetical protein